MGLLQRDSIVGADEFVYVTIWHDGNITAPTFKVPDRELAAENPVPVTKNMARLE